MALPTVTGPNAFVVSDANPGHGLQVFDLTRLRTVTSPETFTEDGHYSGFGSSHTISINETTGFLQSGILGGNFLRQFRVTFDFQRSIIRLEPLGAPGVQNESVATSSAELTRP